MPVLLGAWLKVWVRDRSFREAGGCMKNKRLRSLGFARDDIWVAGKTYGWPELGRCEWTDDAWGLISQE